MGKLLFVIIAFLVSCALFKWPGYLVRDDADARLAEVVSSPGKWFKKIGNLEKKTDADPLTAGADADPFAGSENGSARQGGVYPIPMTIHNTAGTALDVFVLGKGPDFVRFQRNSDNHLFDLRLASLSETSRTSLAPLPTNLRAEEYQQAVQADRAPASPPGPRDNLAEAIRKEIEHNEREIKIQEKMSRGNLFPSSQQKAAIEKAKRLRVENIRLEQKLADYEASF